MRELENVIQRALIMAPGDRIEPEHLNLQVKTSPVRELAEQPLDVPSIEESLSVGAEDDVPTPEQPSALELPAAGRMRDLEREHILRTLADVGGSRKLAVERLGISDRNLRYKLQRYRQEGFFKD